MTLARLLEWRLWFTREWQNLNFAISAGGIKSYLLCERNKAQAQATPSPTLRQTRPETQEALGG
jgi:hypothetical protein